MDNGQGSDTVLVQICAASLGLDVDQVSLATPDTDGSPYNWGTTASRVTYMAGRAVVAAAEDAVSQLKQRAAIMMECAEEDLELRDGGRIGIKGVPEAEIGFRDISGFSHWVAGGPVIGTNSLAYDGPDFDPKRGYLKGFPFGKIGTWIFAAQAVEVEVDKATGRIAPLKIWSAHDIGKAINPTAVEGQIQGGIVQGPGLRALRGNGLGFRASREPVLHGLQDPGHRRDPAGDGHHPGRGPRRRRPVRRQGDRRAAHRGHRTGDLERGRQRHRGPPQAPADDAGTGAADVAGVSGGAHGWSRR